MSNVPPASRDPQTYAIIGAAMEVHRILGPGFSESVYQDAMEVEFLDRRSPHVRERMLHVEYKGHRLPSTFRADFVCYERVLLELKALPRLAPREDAQVLNYLHVTKLPIALLVNFGARSLEHQRFVL
jgi:GxxExxY protein